MRKSKIKILYVSAEISPYASAGGLGEVGKSFPQALQKSKNIEIRRVMPCYKQININLKYIADYPVAIEAGYETCVLKTDPENTDIITYFISNDRYFYRDNIYAYEDDNFRFFFFCRAVVEMLRNIKFKPDIVHTNDWHTGFLPLLLKKEFPSIKSVYTIHNISYHGFLPPAYVAEIVSKEEQILLGYPEWLNFMKAGILYSDLITTVSPGYKKEVMKSVQGFGMSTLLKKRAASFAGILNGIDTDYYDPSKDKILSYPYNITCLERKKKNRSLLRSELGLTDTDIPLIAMVTRLVYEKGIELLLKAVSITDLDSFQLIIMGSGNPYYEGILEEVQTVYPKSVVFVKNYSSEMAKRIYASTDIYLMPSLYEPCGLGQLYALRYGAVPVVNPVGGLKDTVKCSDKYPSRRSGFYMEAWTGEALAKAMMQAVKAYYSPEWESIIRNGMQFNASWSKSVSKYHTRYEEILEKRMRMKQK